MIIVGTVDQCLEKILRYEEAGVDHLLSYQQFGMLPHKKVMRSLELMGTQVIPELEKRGHRIDYACQRTLSSTSGSSRRPARPGRWRPGWCSSAARSG